MTSRLNPILYVVAILLLCACALGGFLVFGEHQDRVDARADQERYGDVLASATAETEAFINIDYREAQASIDAVAAGATGEFEDQYSEASEAVLQVLEQEQSVMEGEVVWAGVVSLDADSARVIAATTGTVANRASGGEPVARAFRIQLDLQLVEGRWLTSNLEFVA
jgi:Mce-associated membrane protein